VISRVMAIDPNLVFDDFDYDLPLELIAQSPATERDQSRLMVIDRSTQSIVHTEMSALPDLLNPGDLLVANNSKVIPARFYAHKRDTGGRVELLLLRAIADRQWQAIAKPLRRLSVGTRLRVLARAGNRPETEIEILERCADGRVRLAFRDDIELEMYGELPLPPYIREIPDDIGRYQTIYGSVLGSAAAPTAGLHFSPSLLAAVQAYGIGWEEVTLHIGLDTFRPATVERVADHQIHREWCSVSEQTASRVEETRRTGHRVVAVGTTSARTLETFSQHPQPARRNGISEETGLFIVPGHEWRSVDGLLTNFHLPRSTLLMMVSSLAGSALIRTAYQQAIAEHYRFFSFGDAMLIL